MRGGRWHIIPYQEIDVSTVARICFEFDPREDILEGILMYKVQRKHAGSDKLSQGKSKQVQLLIAWCGKHTEGLHVRVMLIEHSTKLDKDKLKSLHQKCWPLLKSRINPTVSFWLLDNTTALATTIKAMNEGHRWYISISEQKINDYVMRPLWIDVKRQVSMILAIFFMLICLLSVSLFTKQWILQSIINIQA
jgi:hypothetical protein